MVWLIAAVSLVFLALTLLALREAWFGYPAPRFTARVLTRKEQAILRAAAEAFFPSGGELPSAEQAGIVRYFDRMLAEIPRRQRALIRLLLVFVEHGSLIFGPVRSRMTRQPLEQRMATFRSWELSELYFRRLSFLSLRTLLTLAYFSDPVVSHTLVPVET